MMSRILDEKRILIYRVLDDNHFDRSLLKVYCLFCMYAATLMEENKCRHGCECVEM